MNHHPYKSLPKVIAWGAYRHPDFQFEGYLLANKDDMPPVGKCATGDYYIVLRERHGKIYTDIASEIEFKEPTA